MAMDAARPSSAAGRAEELERENERLREQLRQYAAQATVARGAINEAVHEKDATARIAHQVAVEERATRAAVEVQGNSIGLSIMMHFVNFLLLLILLVGLFLWLPRDIQTRVSPTNVVTTPAPGTVIVPAPR